MRSDCKKYRKERIGEVNYNKSVADKYKNILPQEVYDALYNWEIDMTN